MTPPPTYVFRLYSIAFLKQVSLINCGSQTSRLYSNFYGGSTKELVMLDLSFTSISESNDAEEKKHGSLKLQVFVPVA